MSRLHQHDDPFISPSPATPIGSTIKWAARVVRSSRFSGRRLTLMRLGVILFALVSLILIRYLVLVPLSSFHAATFDTQNVNRNPQPPFQPAESDFYRSPDIVDTFQSYKYRDICKVSSLDLHAPFSPLCHDRASMLAAMSAGGRIGFDAPFMPRTCDMRWFTSEEVCQILGRFDRVLLVGDSMLRHIIGGINILIRKDIGYGAVTDWNFSAQEKKDCFCNKQFDVKACSVQGIYKTIDVMANDPRSFFCTNRVDLAMEGILRFPIPPEEIKRLESSVGGPTELPKAFILGHGLWNDLEIQKTIDWLDTVVGTITAATGPNHWHGLFVSPNAAGREKPDEWMVTQGNKALMMFEEATRTESRKRGIDHLGTWNMSIQANMFDGVHLDMKGNLVKAMMVLNWLNLLDA